MLEVRWLAYDRVLDRVVVAWPGPEVLSPFLNLSISEWVGGCVCVCVCVPLAGLGGVVKTTLVLSLPLTLWFADPYV